MRIVFDEARCDGFGFCAEVAPEFFLLDDDGNLELLQTDVPSDAEEHIHAATRACPVAALRVQSS